MHLKTESKKRGFGRQSGETSHDRVSHSRKKLYATNKKVSERATESRQQSAREKLARTDNLDLSLICVNY